jgi:parallel beta-helix repeat protein
MVAMVAVALTSVISVPSVHAAAATAVTDCRTTVTEPGSYVVAADIASCDGFAITISASRVSLDLAGHEVSCNAVDGRLDVGVDVVNAKSVTVRNGAVRDCDIGVRLWQSTKSTLRDLDVHGNVLDPLLDNRTSEFDNGYGVFLFGSDRNDVVHNTASGNTIGIEINTGSDGNRVAWNVATDNEFAVGSYVPVFGVGIVVAKSDDNRIEHNVTARNSEAGIAACCQSSGNTVSANLAVANGLYGIVMADRTDVPEGGVPRDNEVRRNVALQNGTDLAEVRFDPYATPPDSVVPPCNNTWTRNVFETVVGPSACIG